MFKYFNNMIVIFFIIYSLFLINCSSKNIYRDINKKELLLKWYNHKKMISYNKNYEAKGTVICYYKSKKNYFYFIWHQLDNNKFEFILNDIIGIFKIKVCFASNSFILKDNYGNKYFFSEEKFSDIIKRFIGIPVNLNNLSKWLIGLPKDDKKCNYTLNNKGYIDQISNYNYTIKYLDYYENIIPSLPHVMVLCYNESKIKFKIRNWNLNNVKVAFSW